MTKMDSSGILLSLVLIIALLVMTERNSKEAHKDFMSLSKQLSDIDAKQDRKLNDLRVLVLQERLSTSPKADAGNAPDSVLPADARAKD